MTRPPKKSETIEVRVPYGAKTAFAAHCRREGRTVSEAVRLFMEQEIGGRAQRTRWRLRRWHAVAAAVGGLLLGAVAAPSLAQTTAPTSRAAFDRIDRNGDGVVSYDEFRAR